MIFSKLKKKPCFYNLNNGMLPSSCLHVDLFAWPKKAKEVNMSFWIIRKHIGNHVTIPQKKFFFSIFHVFQTNSPVNLEC